MKFCDVRVCLCVYCLCNVIYEHLRCLYNNNKRVYSGSYSSVNVVIKSVPVMLSSQDVSCGEVGFCLIYVMISVWNSVVAIHVIPTKSESHVLLVFNTCIGCFATNTSIEYNYFCQF